MSLEGGDGGKPSNVSRQVIDSTLGYEGGVELSATKC